MRFVIQRGDGLLWCGDRWDTELPSMFVRLERAQEVLRPLQQVENDNEPND
jgi:hypothetical protein